MGYRNCHVGKKRAVKYDRMSQRAQWMKTRFRNIQASRYISSGVLLNMAIPSKMKLIKTPISNSIQIVAHTERKSGRREGRLGDAVVQVGTWLHLTTGWYFGEHESELRSVRAVICPGVLFVRNLPLE